MLLEKDPCEGCIINVMCQQMCPKVIKFYSNRVRKRSKSEVEQATGYYWEDDYTDPDTGVVHVGRPRGHIEKKSERMKHVKNEPTMFKKMTNWFRL